MEHNSLHIMTAIMADIMMEAYSNDKENDVPREIFIFTLAQFLGDYETESLKEATRRLMIKTLDAQRQLQERSNDGFVIESLEEAEIVHGLYTTLLNGTTIIDKVFEMIEF